MMYVAARHSNLHNQQDDYQPLAACETPCTVRDVVAGMLLEVKVAGGQLCALCLTADGSTLAFHAGFPVKCNWHLINLQEGSAVWGFTLHAQGEVR